jgi:23S rRNA (pseudouridine1915-N3)-methyltransferase
MIKIKIYSVGKTKEEWLQAALDEYERRLKPSIAFEWILAKTDEQLKQYLEKEPHFILLDPKGKQYSSEGFSSFLLKAIQDHHARLTFAIGGPEGFTQELKNKAKTLISLSSMTFTHQMTRLILIEQIYRAIEIDKKSAYHK